jgi:hypothetical protein
VVRGELSYFNDVEARHRCDHVEVAVPVDNLSATADRYRLLRKQSSHFDRRPDQLDIRSL